MQVVVAEAVMEKRRNLAADFFARLVREKPLGVVGAVIVLLLFLTGAFADLSWIGMPGIGLAPYSAYEIHLVDKLTPPSTQYPLGTDTMGRDVLSRIIHGARLSLFVAVGASALNILVGSIIGITSGYFGGKFDLILQRFVDAWLCFPGLLMLITVMSLVGPGLVQIILVLGIGGGIGWSRTIRSVVLGLKENVYVDAARAIGASPLRVMGRHILVNLLPILVIAFSMSMGGNILAEAGMSFLGVGIPPPHPSWGQMLSWEGRNYMMEAPWLAIWPGVALSLVVYGTNVWGDAVRDLLDPRLRGGVGSYGRTKKKVVIKDKTTQTG